MSKELIRQLPLFSDMTEEDLNRIYDMATPTPLKSGEVLIEEGTKGDSMYVVIDGELEVTKRSGNQNVVLSRRGPGEVIGEISLLANEPRNATVRATEESNVLGISRMALSQLLSCSPSAGPALLHTVAGRLRSTEGLLLQHQKMASLGTLAAGLAHELNNPAAAARRSAGQLRDIFSHLQKYDSALHSLSLTQEQETRLSGLRAEIERDASHPRILDPLDRSDQEGDMQMWLEDRSVEDAWEAAPVLVSTGWNKDKLESLLDDFGEDELNVVVPWLAAGASTYILLDEVSKSAERISEIVKAVKTYSYLDQAPIQEVDVHEGLENTIIILKHKLKAGVEVRREYDPNLPRIEAYASELNQVWTNLIDNAIDAMEGQGILTIKTYCVDDSVAVDITDNGPGIPPDVLPRIFEPFFTTKGPGVGTGLGLHIAYNILVVKHHGTIEVDSKPGRTLFHCTLPVVLARE